jgi:formate dehydrogenase iron-sulfur subunit
MVAEAKRRIATAPGTYIPEIYGLEEVGGTSVLHLSSVPFEQIGYITGLPKTPMPDLTHRWLRVTAPAFALLYGLFGALTWIVNRRMRAQGHHGEKP